MQIPLAALLIVFPRRSYEIGRPVVGRFFAVFASALLPYVIVSVFAVLFTAFDKPLVLVARMIDYQIHYKFYSALVHTLDHLFPIIKSTEFVHYIPVIAYVVTVVVVGRLVYGGQPYRIHTQTFYIVQLGYDTPYIAYTVTVAVAKATRIYLIYYRVLVPSSLHNSPPQEQKFPLVICI